MHAEWGATCAFDNYKIWNLEGLEFEAPMPPESFTEGRFYEPILRYISDALPTFEDDFSTEKEEWGNTSFGIPISSYVQEGLIDHMEFLLDPGDSFPTNGLLDANDFALEIYFDNDVQNHENPDIYFQFRSDSANSDGYVIFLKSSTWELKQSFDGDSIAKGAYPGIYGARFLNIIVNDNNLAIYMDRVLVYEGNDFATDFSSNRFVNLDSENQAYGFIYSLKFWNLDGVEFGQEELENQGSQTNDDTTWVTDFVNPIMDYIENRSPDIEDNFDTASSAWVLTINNYPGWNKSFEDGEMIVNGVVENTMITYHDYMVDVDFRHINGISAGIEFDNGSAQYCKVFVSKRGESVHFSCSDPTDFEITPGSTEIVNLRLIVKESKIAVIVNQQPVAYIEDEAFRLYRGVNPMVSLTTNQQGTIAFSNFRVWNLTQLEIP
jgi:hypothetical protein